jgi:hypothetical protein
MNWRRGLSRAWIALAVLWVAAIGWDCSTHFYDEVQSTTLMPWEVTWDKPPTADTVYTIEPVSEWSDAELERDLKTVYWKVSKPWIVLAIAPPLGVLALGLLLFWVVRASPVLAATKPQASISQLQWRPFAADRS